jgi:hypothetical protein
MKAHGVQRTSVGFVGGSLDPPSYPQVKTGTTGHLECVIAKISRGASLYGAVFYNQKKVNEGTARMIGGHRMLSDMSENLNNIMQQTLLSFESYLAANHNTRKPVLHISLNPSPEDRICICFSVASSFVSAAFAFVSTAIAYNTLLHTLDSYPCRLSGYFPSLLYRRCGYFPPAK